MSAILAAGRVVKGTSTLVLVYFLFIPATVLVADHIEYR